MAAGEGCSKAEKRVMVGIDESEWSSYALKWVLDNLKQSCIITSSSLILLMAQPRPNHSNTVAPALLSSARMYCSAASTPELVTSIQERNHMVSVGILEKAKEMCAIHQVEAYRLDDSACYGRFGITARTAPIVRFQEDLWQQVFTVGTKWDQLDMVYQYKWNFSNLEMYLYHEPPPQPQPSTPPLIAWLFLPSES
nr:uncharacterized protein LOC109020114 [Ipomoea trifida]